MMNVVYKYSSYLHNRKLTLEWVDIGPDTLS